MSEILDYFKRICRKVAEKIFDTVTDVILAAMMGASVAAQVTMPYLVGLVLLLLLVTFIYAMLDDFLSDEARERGQPSEWAEKLKFCTAFPDAPDCRQPLAEAVNYLRNLTRVR